MRRWQHVSLAWNAWSPPQAPLPGSPRTLNGIQGRTLGKFGVSCVVMDEAAGGVGSGVPDAVATKRREIGWTRRYCRKGGQRGGVGASYGCGYNPTSLGHVEAWRGAWGHVGAGSQHHRGAQCRVSGPRGSMDVRSRHAWWQGSGSVCRKRHDSPLGRGGEGSLARSLSKKGENPRDGKNQRHKGRDSMHSTEPGHGAAARSGVSLKICRSALSWREQGEGGLGHGDRSARKHGEGTPRGDPRLKEDTLYTDGCDT